MSNAKRSVAAVVLALATVGTAGTAARAAASTGSFTLHVVDSAGHALSGYCVDGYNGFGSDRPTATTDANGNATLTATASAGYTVAAGQCTAATTGPARTYVGGDERYNTAPDYALKAGQTTSLGTLTLPDYATVSGTLKDDLGRTYLSTCIDLDRPVYPAGPFGSATTHTDHYGNFTITGVYPRAHDLFYGDCRGFQFPTTDYVTQTGAPLAVASGASLTGVKLVVAAGAKVLGTLVDDTGAVVKNSGLCVGQTTQPDYPPAGDAQQAAVAADGSFELDRVLGGTQFLMVRVCGDTYDTATNDYVLKDAQQITAVDDKNLTVTETAPRTAGVTGKVTDSAGHPLSNATVALDFVPTQAQKDSYAYDEPTRVATTAADGSFTLRGIQPGRNYAVEAYDTKTGRYAPVTTTATFTGASGQSVAVPTIAMSTPAAVVTGALVAANGAHLQVTQVVTSGLDDQPANVSINKSGFTVAGLPAFSGQQFEVYGVDAQGHRVAGSVLVSATAGQTVKVNVPVGS